MTGWPSAPRDLSGSQQASLRQILARWRVARMGGEPGGEAEVVDMEVLRAGRTGLIDVVAEMDGLLGHAVLGLHRPGDALHVLGSVDEPALGVLEDREGLAVVVDALRDADTARILLAAVAGEQIAGPAGSPDAAGHSAAVVTLVRDDAEATALGIDRRLTMSVFPWLRRGPHPGMTLLAGLDEARFNHLAAPVAFWRRAGRDLGVVRELLAGATGGWALALTSLRDLFAARTSPDAAGGDFAPEAFALGTMAARMHVALDHAFGRQPGDVARWCDDVEAAFARDAPGMLDAPVAGQPEPTLRETLAALRGVGLHPPMIRAHGDFHLGRTARTDLGWVLADCMPGGADPVTGAAVFRFPLADVADMCWSIRHVSVVAAAERGPVTARSQVGELAESWQARNRQAFVTAYLATPGLGGLVPADRRVVHRMLVVLEALRSARGVPPTIPTATASAD